jgi:hypothetical protein
MSGATAQSSLYGRSPGWRYGVAALLLLLLLLLFCVRLDG